LWGIVAIANFMASTAAHKGRGLRKITEFERQNSLDDLSFDPCGRRLRLKSQAKVAPITMQNSGMILTTSNLNLGQLL
jgi:hypothetical protein